MALAFMVPASGFAVAQQANNYGPVLRADPWLFEVVEAGGTGNSIPGTPTASGNFVYTDDDSGDAVFLPEVDPRDGRGGVVEGRADGDTERKPGTPTGTRIPGTYGDMTLYSDGSWYYVLDNAREATQELGVGVRRRDKFKFRIDDGAHLRDDMLRYSSETTVEIEVVGANDLPVLTSSKLRGRVVEAGGHYNNAPGVLTDSGQFSFVDPDAGDTAFVEMLGENPAADGGGVIEGKCISWSSCNTGFFSSATQRGTEIIGQYGTLTLFSGGSWNYRIQSDDLESLGQNASTSERFAIRIDDGDSGAGEGTRYSNFIYLLFYLVGSNDAPRLTGNAALVDATLVAGATSLARVVPSDLFYDVDSADVAYRYPFPGSYKHALDVTTSVDPVVPWVTFDSESGIIFADPPKGSEGTYRVTVTATDHSDAATNTTFQITVLAQVANASAPELTVTSDVNPPKVVEAGGFSNANQGTPSVAGTFEYSDGDSGDVDFVTVLNPGSDGGGIIEGRAAGTLNFAQGTPAPDGTEISGVYGTLKLFSGGSWSYELDNGLTVTQALAGGAVARDRFQFRIDDGFYVEANRYSAIIPVEITIEGADDTPFLESEGTTRATESGGVDNFEMGTSTLEGRLSIVDWDGPSGSSVFEGRRRNGTFVRSSDAGARIVGRWGELRLFSDGRWTYKIDNESANVEGIYRRLTVFDYFRVRADFGNEVRGQESQYSREVPLDFGILGANDAPRVGDGKTIPAATVEVGALSWQLAVPTGLFEDADGDNTPGGSYNYPNATSISIAISSQPEAAWLEYDSGSNTISGVPPVGSEGAYDVTLTATDRHLAAVETSFLLQVVPPVQGGGAAIRTHSNAPELSMSPSSGPTTVEEAGGENNSDPGTPTTSGSFVYKDDDPGDTGFRARVDAENDNGGVIEGRVSGASVWIPGSPSGSKIDGTYGALWLTYDGTWAYALDNERHATQALAGGAKQRDRFDFRIDDGAHVDPEHRHSNVLTVEIDVLGANDLPVLVLEAPELTAEVKEAGGVRNRELGNPTTSGRYLLIDVDGGDGNIVIEGSKWAGGFVESSQEGTKIAGQYGTLTLFENGNWSYELNDDTTDTEALARYSYRPSSAFGRAYDWFDFRLKYGGSSSATGIRYSKSVMQYIRILGANDAPRIAEGMSLGNATISTGTRSWTKTVPMGFFEDVDRDNVDGGGHGMAFVLSGEVSPDVDWVSFDAESRTFSASPPVGSEGEYTVTVTATDRFGATVSDSFQLTVRSPHMNANAPSLTFDATASYTVTEEGGLDNADEGIRTVSGEFGYSDLDNDDAGFVNAIDPAHNRGGVIEGRSAGFRETFVAGTPGTGTTIAGVYGNLTLFSNGEWNYKLENGWDTTQALNAGAGTDPDATDRFQFRIDDGAHVARNRYSDIVSVAIEINGANDLPVIESTHWYGYPVHEAGNTNDLYLGGGGVPRVAGQLSIFNPDGGDNDVILEGKPISGSSFLAATDAGTEIPGSYGTLKLVSDGSWSYSLNNNLPRTDSEPLRPNGPVSVDKFLVRMNFRNMIAAAQAEHSQNVDLRILVYGYNDAPRVAANMVFEDAVVAADAGTWELVVPDGFFEDVDIDDFPGGVGNLYSTPTLTLEVPEARELPWLGFNAATRTISASPRAGTEGRHEITVKATDRHGASVSESFWLRVVAPLASEHRPVLEADSPSGSAVEAGVAGQGTPNVTGEFTYSDADPGDADFVATISPYDDRGGIVEGRPSGPGAFEAGIPGGRPIRGTYGILSLDSDGTWSYELKNDWPATQALAGGAPVSDSFDFRIDDGAHIAQDRYSPEVTVAVSVTGANDNPVAVTQDPPALAASSITAGTTLHNVLAGAEDPDSDDAVGGSVVVSGFWNAEADAPVTATDAGGTLSFPGLGDLSVAATGEVTLVPSIELEALTVDDPQASARVGFAITDGTTAPSTDQAESWVATLALEVNGTAPPNDAPSAVDDALAITEDATSTSPATLNVIAGTAVEGVGADSDDGGPGANNLTVRRYSPGRSLDPGTAKEAGSPATGAYGKLTISATGDVSYEFLTEAEDAAKFAALQALGRGAPAADVFAYQIVDGGKKTATAVLTVTVTGANDAPAAAAPVTLTRNSDAVDAGTQLHDVLAAGAVVDVDVGDSVAVGTFWDMDAASTVAPTPAGEPLAVAAFGDFSIAAGGEVTLSPSLALQDLSTADQPVTARIGYALSDGIVAASTDQADGWVGMLTLTVNGTAAPNQAPAASDDALGITEDATTTTPAALNVIAGTLDASNVAVGGDMDDRGSGPDNLSVARYSPGEALDDTTAVDAGVAATGRFGKLTISATGDAAYAFVAKAGNEAKFEALQELSGGVPGLDVFTYEIVDRRGEKATAKVTVTVTGANDDPVAEPDTPAAALADTVVAGTSLHNVLGNDGDPDAADAVGGNVVVSGFWNAEGAEPHVATAAGGTLAFPGMGGVSVAASGEVTLAPNEALLALTTADAPAVARIGYAITDGTTARSTNQDRDWVSTLVLTVNGSVTPNERPLTKNDPLAIEEGATVTTPPELNVVANDNDDGGRENLAVVRYYPGNSPDGVISASAGSAVAGAYGNLTITAKGDVTYVFLTEAEDATKYAALKALVPGPDNPRGTDVFSYVIEDGDGVEATGQVIVTVTGVNDDPEPILDRFRVKGIGAATVSDNVAKNDKDPDTGHKSRLEVKRLWSGSENRGAEVAASGRTPLVGRYGSISIGRDGGFVYTPGDEAERRLPSAIVPPLPNPVEEFSYLVSDGVAEVWGTLRIEIEPVNIEPEYDASVGLDRLGADAIDGDDGDTSSGSFAWSYRIPDGAFVDPEGQSLTYSISDNPDWITFDVASRELRGQLDKTRFARVTDATDPEPSPPQVAMTLAAADPGGKESEREFSIAFAPASLELLSFEQEAETLVLTARRTGSPIAVSVAGTLSSAEADPILGTSGVSKTFEFPVQAVSGEVRASVKLPVENAEAIGRSYSLGFVASELGRQGYKIAYGSNFTNANVRDSRPAFTIKKAASNNPDKKVRFRVQRIGNNTEGVTVEVTITHEDGSTSTNSIEMPDFKGQSGTQKKFFGVKRKSGSNGGTVKATIMSTTGQGAYNVGAVTSTTSKPSVSATYYFNGGPSANDDDLPVTDGTGPARVNVILGRTPDAATSAGADTDPDNSDTSPRIHAEGLFVTGYAAAGNAASYADVAKGDRKDPTEEAVGTYGSLVIAATGEAIYTPGLGARALGDRVSRTDRFHYEITDTSPFSQAIARRSTATLTVQVSGVDDPTVIAELDDPVVASDSPDKEVTESGGSANVDHGDSSAGGQLEISDPDTGQGGFARSEWEFQVQDGGAWISAAAAGTKVRGTYGDLTLDAEGAWTYMLVEGSPTLEGLSQEDLEVAQRTERLRAGAPVFDEFVFRGARIVPVNSDPLGGTAGSGPTESLTLAITVNGAEDEPDAVKDAHKVYLDDPATHVLNVLDNDVDFDTVGLVGQAGLTVMRVTQKQSSGGSVIQHLAETPIGATLPVNNTTDYGEVSFRPNGEVRIVPNEATVPAEGNVKLYFEYRIKDDGSTPLYDVGEIVLTLRASKPNNGMNSPPGSTAPPGPLGNLAIVVAPSRLVSLEVGEGDVSASVNVLDNVGGEFGGESVGDLVVTRYSAGYPFDADRAVAAGSPMGVEGLFGVLRVTADGAATYTPLPAGRTPGDVAGTDEFAFEFASLASSGDLGIPVETAALAFTVLPDSAPLVVANGFDRKRIELAGSANRVEFAIPDDAFADPDGDGREHGPVLRAAILEGGARIPLTEFRNASGAGHWLRFDAETGTFRGEIPAGYGAGRESAEISVEVSAFAVDGGIPGSSNAAADASFSFVLEIVWLDPEAREPGAEPVAGLQAPGISWSIVDGVLSGMPGPGPGGAFSRTAGAGVKAAPLLEFFGAEIGEESGWRTKRDRSHKPHRVVRETASGAVGSDSEAGFGDILGSPAGGTRALRPTSGAQTQARAKIWADARADDLRLGESGVDGELASRHLGFSVPLDGSVSVGVGLARTTASLGAGARDLSSTASFPESEARSGGGGWASIDMTQLTASPFVSVSRDKSRHWAAFGLGQGEMSVSRDASGGPGASEISGVSMRLVAAGTEFGHEIDIGFGERLEATGRVDALSASMDVGGAVEAAAPWAGGAGGRERATLRGLRGELALGMPLELGPGLVEPSVTAGYRLESGTATAWSESGALLGAASLDARAREIGASVAFSISDASAVLGVRSLEGRGGSRSPGSRQSGYSLEAVHDRSGDGMGVLLSASFESGAGAVAEMDPFALSAADSVVSVDPVDGTRVSARVAYSVGQARDSSLLVFAERAGAGAAFGLERESGPGSLELSLEGAPGASAGAEGGPRAGVKAKLQF